MSGQLYRRGPVRNLGAAPGFAEIRNFFQFRSIRIGAWVSEAERDSSARNFFIGLLDLQEILEVPREVISLRGQLSLHYGAGGQLGVSAHYQPSSRTLALAKNAGAGSLAHEWFHAFDHYIADHLFTESVAGRFASTAWLAEFEPKPHPLCQALSILYKTILLDQSGNQSSDLVKRSIRADKAQNQLYWSRPEEVCARAFEAYIEDAAIKNSFLAAGSRSQDSSAGVYPSGSEREQMALAFSHYFSMLGLALTKSLSD